MATEPTTSSSGRYEELFTRARRFVTGAAMLGLAAITAAFPAAAQTATLPPNQCADAIKIANSLVQENKGKVSGELIDSFVRFGKSSCDLNIDWKLANNADHDVFGKFRLHLTGMRRAAVTPASVIR